MKNKVLVAIICVAVVIISGGIVVAVTQNGGNETTTNVTESTTETTETVSQTEESTSESTTETTTAPTEAKANYPFLKKSVWYLYDDAKRVAYGFKFDDEDDVIVAYFDEDNINGEDAKYSKDKVDYKIENGVIVVTDLPEDYGVSVFKFTISGEDLKDESGNTLEKQADLKLEYPFDHFNA